MRTKTLLLTAALAVAGASTSMAQSSNVYSVNVVGYINVPVQANKFFLLDNPFNNSVNNVVTNVLILNDNFDLSAVYTFDGIGVNPVETYFAGFGWFPGTNTLVPGQGYYLFPTFAGTVTYTGSVQTNSQVKLKPGFNLVGSPYPGSLDITALGIQGADLDVIYRFDSTNQTLSLLNTFFDGYGWLDSGSGGPTNGFTPNPAEGYFYFNSHPTTNNWNQAFSIQ